jgi:hypothetical protein
MDQAHSITDSVRPRIDISQKAGQLTIDDEMAHSPYASQSAIAKLPTELVDAVAELLDKSSLCSLALVSKSMEPSATNNLYKEYYNLEAPSKAPFALFLRTIYERPDLAAKVKFVYIRGW